MAEDDPANLTSIDDFLNSPVRPTMGSTSGADPSAEADDPFASPLRNSSPLPDCPTAGVRSFSTAGLDREGSEDPASTSNSVPVLALTTRVSNLNRFASGQGFYKRLCVEGRNSVTTYVAVRSRRFDMMPAHHVPATPPKSENVLPRFPTFVSKISRQHFRNIFLVL